MVDPNVLVVAGPAPRPGAPSGQRSDLGSGAPALRTFSYWLLRFRQGWRRGLLFSLLAPCLYLVVMGLVMGSYIDERPGALDEIGTTSYLAFIAPAVVISSAMLVAVTDSSFPVLHAFQSARSYLAMIATPLTVRDIVAGHLLWVAARVAVVATVLVAVVVAMGAASSPAVVGIVPVAVLTGVGFAGWVSALTSTLHRDTGLLAIQRLGTTPMLLFSGIFYPVALLPAALELVVKLTPLWHGAELARALAAGRLGPIDVVHLLWLVVVAVSGALVATRLYRRRLVA